MRTVVSSLYPEAREHLPLRGLYLAHHNERQGERGRPFIYASFVSSLDGRIALGSGDDSHVPPALNNLNDWRLLQELQAQADCFLTGAGYLRSIATGKLPDILQVGVQPESRDLGEWRANAALTGQPAIVIPTVSLDIELPASLREREQAVHIVTTTDADRDRIGAFQHDGIKVHVRGSGRHVDGNALAALLGELGYRSVYCLAGPQMLSTL
ncbi:MAG: dihydrofolate reductase family protein, partial [Burkholderiales bacterium]|nr:dihydrofolate reductase family protein [Burkholderiales bacterium]